MTATHIVCPACAASGGTIEPFYYRWRGRVFDLARCPTCTHQFVYPPVTPEDQAVIYSDAYFQKGGDWAVGVFPESYTDSTPELIKEARAVLAMLPPGGTLVDLGCAGGLFLHEAQQAGYTVQGVELNAQMAQHARDRYGLTVLTSRLEDIPTDYFLPGSVDVVTLMDCLEHIPEPLAVLRSVARWVKPGGALFIRGPLQNTRSGALKESLRRTLGIRKQLPGYPLDANAFNKRSLTTMLLAAGFHAPHWIGEAPGFANVSATRIPTSAPVTV
jgi:2-polyprenyl-3-methyl-5-hydroxy-6-metoxy-1,4-benzoquinol methylase